MSRRDILIIKDTHRGLLYEDGVFRDVLPAGRYEIPRLPTSLAAFFGARAPKVEVILVDVRGRDRTIVVQDLLTADGATISASFVVQFRVVDPLAAIHQVKSFEDRLYAEVQTAARRILRGLSVEEVLASRDEIGEELQLQVKESAALYGLEVTGLDFKDLIVSEDLRRIMNRAVLAKRLRQVQMAEGRPGDDLDGLDDDALVASHAGDLDTEAEDDSNLIFAKATFGRERASDGLLIRPHGQESRTSGFYSSGVDLSLRRCRP